MIGIGWLGLANAVTFGLFAWDKFRARRGGRRVPEFQLLGWSALGGWPAGLLAMIVFRHKTSKVSFFIKFSLAIAVSLALSYIGWTGAR